ncbi:MAG: hypothetical protein KAT68_11580, partial [Bacteroidales bacterium]|nr:hypothetical protein [Bacteroidales bacterium]
GVGDPEWDGTGYRGFDAGKNLKSTSGWYSNGNGSNAYGFTALPGGYRSPSGYFSYIEEYAGFWSSTENVSNKAWYRRLDYGSDEVYRSDYYKEVGRSVRCIKD